MNVRLAFLLAFVFITWTGFIFYVAAGGVEEPDQPSITIEEVIPPIPIPKLPEQPIIMVPDTVIILTPPPPKVENSRPRKKKEIPILVPIATGQTNDDPSPRIIR